MTYRLAVRNAISTCSGYETLLTEVFLDQKIQEQVEFILSAKRAQCIGDGEYHHAVLAFGARKEAPQFPLIELGVGRSIPTFLGYLRRLKFSSYESYFYNIPASFVRNEAGRLFEDGRMKQAWDQEKFALFFIGHVFQALSERCFYLSIAWPGPAGFIALSGELENALP